MLYVYGGTGAILLDSPANAVGTLGNASTVVGDVTFVNSVGFATGPVTAGDAVAPGVPNDGNIFLKAGTGSIAVNGTLTALQDRVTLDAAGGTITFGPGVAILADVLVYYYSPSAPVPVLPATRPSIVAANGDLDIVNPLPTNSVLNSGYETTGNITIRSVTGFDVSGLLRTTGAGKFVRLTADTGSIRFLGSGGAASTGAGGTVTIQATTGSFTGAATTVVRATDATITVGSGLAMAGTVAADALTVSGAGQAISLAGTNALGSIRVTNGGTVTVGDSSGGLVVAGIDASGDVTINAAGAVSQTAAITAAALAVNASGAAIALDTQSNAVASFAASNFAGAVRFNDTAGDLTLAGITGGAVTIGAAGAV
ncbi:MAG: hypothetical protein EBX36_10225, partial [Planctomycetia bacterium]|nr:hypothetical protein [Planctomycetia bacterium]